MFWSAIPSTTPGFCECWSSIASVDIANDSVFFFLFLFVCCPLFSFSFGNQIVAPVKIEGTPVHHLLADNNLYTQHKPVANLYIHVGMLDWVY